MSWKKTTPYFLYQSMRYAQSGAEFRQNLRYYRRWKQFMQSGHNSVADERPWLNFPALDLLERALPPGAKVFEYGGGGSTLYFCNRASEVVTVENDPKWFAVLTQKIAGKNHQHWRGMLIDGIPDASTAPRDPANPDHFASKAAGSEALNFERYARAIDSFPDDYFDLILVDGRSRPSCIRQALPHLKSGGLLVVDNTERPYYLTTFYQYAAQGFQIESDQMAPIAYTPDFVKTSVFRKK